MGKDIRSMTAMNIRIDDVLESLGSLRRSMEKVG